MLHDSAILTLAFRYLSVLEQGTDGRFRLSGFASKQSLNSIVGLALGVAVLLVVLSIVNGFEREMRERILAVLPHAVLHHQQGFRDWQTQADTVLDPNGITAGLQRPLAIAPLIDFQALLVRGERLASVQVKGIEPAAEKQVSIVHELMLSGSLDELDTQPYGIVLGERLAQKLGVMPGDSIKLVLPEARMSLLGVLPRYRQFEVLGVFRVGAAMDEQMAYIHVETASSLLRMQGRVDQLRLKMPELFSASWDAWQIAMALNDNDTSPTDLWFASDWTQNQGSLYQLIVMTKSMLGLLVLLIVVVACFNLASGLIMMVNEKRADIAILLSQGLQPRQLIAVFVIQALLIALLGLLLGLLGGGLLLNVLGDAVLGLEALLKVDLTSAYPVHYLPSQVLMSDVLLIAVSVLVLSVLASLYPAWLAAHVKPAEELKYE